MITVTMYFLCARCGKYSALQFEAETLLAVLYKYGKASRVPHLCDHCLFVEAVKNASIHE